VFANKAELDAWLIRSAEQMLPSFDASAVVWPISKAQDLWECRSEKNLERIVEFCQSAIALNPHDAEAYGILACAHICAALNDRVRPSRVFPLARKAIGKAFRSNPFQSQALCAQAWLRMWEDHAWDAAETQFREILELESDDSFASAGLAIICCVRHEFEEAAMLLKSAMEADPLSPSLTYGVIHLLYRSGHYDLALSDTASARMSGCDSSGIGAIAGLIHLVHGKFEDAVRELGSAAVVFPDNPNILGALGYACASCGQEAQARKILDDLKHSESRKANCGAYGIALVSLGLNEIEESLHWLAEAQEQRSIWLLTITLDRLFLPLHQHPGFLSLTRKMHLPDVPLSRS